MNPNRAPSPVSLPPALPRTLGAVLAAAAAWLAAAAPAGAQAGAQEAAAEGDAPARTVVQNGVKARLELAPAGGEAGDPLRAKANSVVRLRLTEAGSGEPVTGKIPAAWIDNRDPRHVRSKRQCKRRIERYMPKRMKTRPVVDLNSYVVLGLTRGNVITVLDPFFGFGSTQMVTTVRLPGQGEDWTTGPEERFVYVTIPRRNRVAVVSTDTWEVVREIPTGTRPTRLARQPGAKRLWVATDGGSDSGVTVIDLVTRRVAGRVATAAGHHEIAFSPDGRRAFVANPDDGTVSVIDADRLVEVRTLEPGPRPTDLAWSEHSGRLYVVDETAGTIHAYEGDGLGLAARMTGSPGLWHLEFDPSGRWGFVLNRETDEIHVLDAGVDEVRYGLMSEGVPDEVAFTEHFAYVRSRASSQVMMIGLRSLEPGRQGGDFARDFSGEGPEVAGEETGVAAVHFPAGEAPPRKAGTLTAAEPMDQAPHKRDALYVPNPFEKSIYFYHYMEGMPTPAGNLKTYSFEPVAAMTVGRQLDEVEPGVYEAVVRISSAGDYEFNFILEEPRVVDCLPMSVDRNPEVAAADRSVSLDLQADPEGDRQIVVGESSRVRFRLQEYGTGDVRGDFERVRARVMSAAGWLTEAEARPVEGSEAYEVEVRVPEPGPYYLTVAIPEMDKGFQGQHPLSLHAVPPGEAAASTAAASRGGDGSGSRGAGSDEDRDGEGSGEAGGAGGDDGS